MAQVKSGLAWLLLVVLLAFGQSSWAQQNPTTATPTTARQNSASTTTTRQNTYELEKENAERVAASQRANKTGVD